MHFITEFKRGQQGKNKGLWMGEGLSTLYHKINGSQKGMIYSVGAGPKVGKTTLVDVGFCIEPLLYAIENNIPIDIIYFSLEIDRVSKEFDFCAHFIARDYNITEVELPVGITYDGGKRKIPISAKYLRGRLVDDNGNAILVSQEILSLVITIYNSRIRMLFGKYDLQGRLLEEGYIKFYDVKENPTGLRNKIFKYAEANGTFIREKFKHKQDNKQYAQIVGYVPTDPDKYVFIITDHLRKLKAEKDLRFMKDRVDKFVEYSVEFRNWCNYSFVHIIHLNRSLADPSRLAYAKDMLYPNGDDFKDTGNLSEESDYVFTMMNPNDQRYHLVKHFGKMIKDARTKDELYPNMRTVHLVDSRHSDFPLHFRYIMHGGIKSFDRLIIPD